MIGKATPIYGYTERKRLLWLRRYMQWSLEAGRVPSLLGRELFRAKISAFTAATLRQRFIFCMI